MGNLSNGRSIIPHMLWMDIVIGGEGGLPLGPLATTHTTQIRNSPYNWEQSDHRPFVAEIRIDLGASYKKKNSCRATRGVIDADWQPSES